MTTFRKIFILVGVFVASTPASYASDPEQEALKDELRELFLQEEIDNITADDLSIRRDLGESWLRWSKSYELGVVKSLVETIGNLQLESYISDDSPVALTSLADEIDNGEQQYRMLRDAHPKAHQCVNTEFIVNENDVFPADSFLGAAGNYGAVVRFSSTGPSPRSDTVKDIRGAAIQVMTPEGEPHDFVMTSDKTFVTDNSQQFLSLIRAIRLGGCMEAIKEDEDVNHWAAKLWSAGQCLAESEVSIFDVPSIISGAIATRRSTEAADVNSVFEKSFFSATPYAYENTTFKFEMSPADCTEYNDEDFSMSETELTEVEGLGSNIRRVLDAGPACYDLNAIVRPRGLSNFSAIERLTKSWDERSHRTNTRHRVASVVVSQIATDDGISPLECDEMTINPGHMMAGFKALGSVNRARAIVYERLSSFRTRSNEYLRAQ